MYICMRLPMHVLTRAPARKSTTYVTIGRTRRCTSSPLASSQFRAALERRLHGLFARFRLLSEFAGMMQTFVPRQIHACKEFCTIWIIREKYSQAELSESKIFPNDANGFCTILHGNSREFVATMCTDIRQK